MKVYRSINLALISTYSLSDIKGEDDKKLSKIIFYIEKKLKKYVIEETDSNEVAAEKVAKMVFIIFNIALRVR